MKPMLLISLLVYVFTWGALYLDLTLNDLRENAEGRWNRYKDRTLLAKLLKKIN